MIYLTSWRTAMRLHNFRIINYLQNQVFQLRDELTRTQRENELLKKELRVYRESREWLF